MRAAGLGGEAMADGEIFDRRAAREALIIADLSVSVRDGANIHTVNRLALATSLQAWLSAEGDFDLPKGSGLGPVASGQEGEGGDDGGEDDEEGEEIIVTGRRPNEVDEEGGDGGGWPWEPDPGGDSGGDTPGGEGGMGGPDLPPPDLTECLSAEEFDQLSPEQQEDYLVAVEAAEIAREIAAKPDRDSREYGSIIYRDANGVITHTPVAGGTATTVGAIATGLPNWGSALGVIHSHPAILFDDENPSFRLHPTPGADGDWAAFNARQTLIAQDLMSQGYSSSAAWAQANAFTAFVYGAAGSPDSGSYELRRYDDSDEARQYTPSANQTANAEKVNVNLGTCGG